MSLLPDDENTCKSNELSDYVNTEGIILKVCTDLNEKRLFFSVK